MALLVAGCATMDTVKDAPLDKGTAQSFNAGYEHTAAATLKALSSLNIELASSAENADGTMYLVSKPMSFFSYGEVGRVWVRKAPSPPTVVYVTWQKRDQLQITGTGEDEFADALFRAIGKAL